LVRIEETAVNALSQEIERSAFHGGSVPDSTPWVLSYESQFSAGYDFNAGNDKLSSEACGLAEFYSIHPRRNQSYHEAAKMVRFS
jgi:hypothetical protein